MNVETIISGSAHYSDAGNTTITCQVKFAEFEAPLPFTATADGAEDHEQAVWTLLLAGEAGPIAPFEPPAEATPESVADWQFAAQAAFEGIITRAEAQAWAARGEVPPSLDQAVSGLVTDPDALFELRMLLAGAKSYERSNPVVAMLGPVFGKDAAGLDEFWREAFKRGVSALAG